MEAPVNLHPFMTPASQSLHEVSFRHNDMSDTTSTPLGGKSVADSTSIEEGEDRIPTEYIKLSDSFQVPQPLQRRFKSARLISEYEKPWLQEHYYRKRERSDKIILGVCALLGLALGALICYTEWNQLPVHDYCLLLEDHFETINLASWSHEIGVGGFGYGSFDWTTDDPENSYTSDTGLHILPTLTVDTTDITENQIYNGFTVNLTADGTCTSPALVQCARYSNSTNGTIINPVRSARLTTAGKVAIKYGRVEVVAKMPKGDWLLPSIWMYPENETYGAWPRSGEIDIAQIRGNSAENYAGGRDTVTSALHWGTSANLDQSARTTGKFELRREDLAAGFHTYGVEWSATHFFTWIDDRVWRTLHTGFGAKYGGNMYERAGFPNMWINGQLPPDIWAMTGLYNTPFDQPFHLIINLAVGSNNGFFPDGQGNKPWIDGATSSMREFWNANETWLPTWAKGEDRGMTIKSVKMWQQGKCGA